MSWIVEAGRAWRSSACEKIFRAAALAIGAMNVKLGRRAASQRP